MRLLVLATVVLALASCSDEPDVDWDRYETGVRVKIDIDRLASAGDCEALAARRRNADAGDLATYIDHKLDEAGCS